MLTLILKARKNETNPELPLPKASRPTFSMTHEAVAAFEKWRDENGLGASNMAVGCGNILKGGKVVARLSYNGRYWPTQEA